MNVTLGDSLCQSGNAIKLHVHVRLCKQVLRQLNI